jgi:cephalosporin-C deacetylase
MPLIDKPLGELRIYQGTNPRPDDFDAYWDDALAEMQAVDPQVELRPAAFETPFAECFDLYFTGVGGSRVHAKYLRPTAVAEPRPAVLQFHGYSGDCGDWFEKLAYVAQGLCVAAMDCRGQGGISEDLGGVRGNTFKGQIIRGLDDDPRKFLFRQIFLDAAQLGRIVASFEEVDGERLGSAGASQGGGLALACAALLPEVKRVVPVFPFLCDCKRVWEMDLAEGPYEELRTYFRKYDPLHVREEEIFTKLGYIDVQHLAPRIQGKVLMACGLMDKICPPSTQFAAYNKITSEKEMIIYPDFAHETLPGFNDRVFQFLAKL